MFEVTRDTYQRFLNGYGRGLLNTNDVVGTDISVMQYTDKTTGKLIAQAIYATGGGRRYEVYCKVEDWQVASFGAQVK